MSIPGPVMRLALALAAVAAIVVGGAGQATAAPPGTGVVVGTVTGKATTYVLGKSNCYIEVKDDKGKVERYVIHWTMEGYPPPGGYDKEMLAAIGLRNVGDRVEIRFTSDEAHRVHTLRVLTISPAAASQPGFDGGTAIGRVMEKSKDFLVIKPDNAEPARYLPQRIVGEKDSFDKDVFRAMSVTAIGSRVEARWFGDGERRIYSLRPAAAVARPATAPDRAAVTMPPQKSPDDQARAAEKLKLAQMYLDGKMKDRARETLQAIIKDFPNTEAAKDAQARLKGLGG
jgi:hypothetical protein